MISKKAASSILIFNILVGIFAFAFLMGGMGVVSGQSKKIVQVVDGDNELVTLEKLNLPAGTDSKGIGEKLGLEKGQLKKSAMYAAGGAALGFAAKELAGDSPWGAALGNAFTVAGGVSSVANLFGGFVGANALPIGLGVGVIVFILTYKEVEYETVFFTCQPWEAPIGGKDCEKCNDGIHPCSEYRCKSLGQACEIVNKGEENELCVWINPKDVNSPSIRPLNGVLTEGYQYVPLGARPPNWGMNIKPASEDCIPAFTPIQFGIETDKPAQCKIDFLIREGGGQAAGEGSSTTRGVEPLGYDEMEFHFGNNNLFDYNHTQRLNLPSPDTVNRIGELNVADGQELEIRNDGNYNMYVRCRSANGFYNADPYMINFCVEAGPDLTPPIIQETSIRDGQPVNFEVDEVPISVFTNEPANCRWARSNDLSFQEMTNEMVCANNLEDIRDNLLYECRTTLTGIQDRKENTFYFRCEDQPWEDVANRNRMQIGKPLTIIGTQPLNIKDGSVKPVTGSVVTGATTTVTLSLELETQNGYQDGTASCLFSTDNSTYIKFKESDSHIHKQSQDLSQGTYKYYYQCIDLGGNLAQTTTDFEVFIDSLAPRVVRVLNDANRLKIITDEDAVCRYSNDKNVGCNFDLSLGEGNPLRYPQQDIESEHLAEWKLDETYYIKCEDKNGKQPNPTQCSIIVQPVELAE